MPRFSATDLMTIVGLAVVLTVVKTSLSYAEAILSATGVGEVAVDFLYGVAVFAAAVAAYRVRKVGTNFLVNIIQGFASLLLGAPMSIYMVIYAAGWGITADVIMGATLFKRRIAIFLAAGAIAGIVVGGFDAVFFREWFLGYGGEIWLYLNWIARILGGLVGYGLGFSLSKGLVKAGLIAKE